MAIETECVLGTCTKKASYFFPLSSTICINLCADCWHKVIREQIDQVKNELCEHEWHADQDTMKNFCVHCEIEQPETERFDELGKRIFGEK